MVSFGVKFQRRETLGLTVREFGELKQRTWKAAGQYWSKVMLPRHFQKSAHNTYRYQPRSPKYLKRKERMAERGKAEKGGTTDLVLSGDLEQKVKDHVFIRTYPSRMTMKLIGPSYLTSKPKGSRPNMGQELFAISDGEWKMITRRMQRVSDAVLKEIRKRGVMKTKKL